MKSTSSEKYKKADAQKAEEDYLIIFRLRNLSQKNMLFSDAFCEHGAVKRIQREEHLIAAKRGAIHHYVHLNSKKIAEDVCHHKPVFDVESNSALHCCLGRCICSKIRILDFNYYAAKTLLQMVQHFPAYSLTAPVTHDGEIVEQNIRAAFAFYNYRIRGQDAIFKGTDAFRAPKEHKKNDCDERLYLLAPEILAHMFFVNGDNFRERKLAIYHVPPPKIYNMYLIVAYTVLIFPALFDIITKLCTVDYAFFVRRAELFGAQAANGFLKAESACCRIYEEKLRFCERCFDWRCAAAALTKRFLRFSQVKKSSASQAVNMKPLEIQKARQTG